MTTAVKRRLLGAGTVAGLSALALIASPAVGSAAVTGTATVTANAGKGTISISISELSTTKPFVKCEGTVYRGDATVLDKTTKVGESFLLEGKDMIAGQVLTNVSGTGTSKVFADGEYQVRTKCKEEGDVDYQDPIAPVKLTVTGGAEQGSGSSDFSLKGLLGLLGGLAS